MKIINIIIILILIVLVSGCESVIEKYEKDLTECKEAAIKDFGFKNPNCRTSNNNAFTQPTDCRCVEYIITDTTISKKKDSLVEFDMVKK